MREDRELTTPQQSINAISALGAAVPEDTSSDHATKIPAIIEGKNILKKHPYYPETFRAWIKNGIIKARSAYEETPKPERTEAMKIDRRIFECLDAATEKNLDRGADKEAALTLLDKVNWSDIMGGGYVNFRDKQEKKPISAAPYQESGDAQAERNRMNMQGIVDEAAAKELRLLNGALRVAEKERKEREAKEARKADREDERLRDETWRNERDQDIGTELDDDDLP